MVGLGVVAIFLLLLLFAICTKPVATADVTIIKNAIRTGVSSFGTGFPTFAPAETPELIELPAFLAASSAICCNNSPEVPGTGGAGGTGAVGGMVVGKLVVGMFVEKFVMGIFVGAGGGPEGVGIVVVR